MDVALRHDDSCVWEVHLAPDDDRDEVMISDRGLLRLIEILGRANCDEACRVVVMRSQQLAFCRGMDLGGALAADVDSLGPSTARYGEMLLALRRARPLTVALVEGPAIAGGVGLVAASDYVLATTDAVFGLPEVTLGLLPAMVLPLLVDRIGKQAARRFARRGLSVDATGALRMGLVDEIVDPEHVDRTLRKALRGLLRAHPGALVELDGLLDALSTASLFEGIELGQESTARRLADSEVRDGIRAAVDGEPIPWHIKPPRR